MREIKILFVVVFFTLVTYYGVEPYAHSVMHKHVSDADYTFSDLDEMTKVGDPKKGQELVFGAGACLGCHSLKSQGMPAAVDAVAASASYGVNPPDLSNVGALYSDKFLFNLIKNPAHALKVEHKYDPASGKMHPMVPFYGAGGDLDQEVADMVAYLKSIAPQEVTPKEAFETACGRCHAGRYKKWTQIGEEPKFKYEKDKLAFNIKVLEYQDNLKKYMGKLPPDLSIIIRARSEHFLNTFINDPQKQLPGTAMPRVGLTKEGQEKVMEYLEEMGDPSKHARQALGPWVLLYLVVFALAALLWKKSTWKDH